MVVEEPLQGVMEGAQKVGDHVYLSIQKNNSNCLPFSFFLTMFLAIHRSSYYRLQSHHSRASYRFHPNAEQLYIYSTDERPSMVQSDKLLVSSDKGDGWSIHSHRQVLFDDLEETMTPREVPISVQLEEVWEFVGDHGRYECIKCVTGTSKPDAVAKKPVFQIRILSKSPYEHVPDQLISMALDIIGQPTK
jgi:hypothetical protein